MEGNPESFAGHPTATDMLEDLLFYGLVMRAAIWARIARRVMKCS